MLTLSSNLQGMLTLARLTRRILSPGPTSSRRAWSHVLFFVPKVYGTDAMLLTLFSFA